MATSTKIWGSGTRTLQTIDLHAAGEPARVVIGGLPPIPGISMAEKRIYLMNHADHFRKILLQEPRGYPCQNANLIFPCSPPALYGYVILEQNKIYPMMSGHNTICVATALLESGMIPINENNENKTFFELEAPAGLIGIEATSNGYGKIIDIKLKNQPSFIAKNGLNVILNIPQCNIGQIKVDIVFGGMWYVIVNAKDINLDLIPSNGKNICKFGEIIKISCQEQFPVNHPCYDYPGVDILVFTTPSTNVIKSNMKNAVVMSNGILKWEDPATWTAMIDRSPCGTGTCAVMTSLWAKGKLKIGENFVHEGILGTCFVGCLTKEVSFKATKKSPIMSSATVNNNDNDDEDGDDSNNNDDRRKKIKKQKKDKAEVEDIKENSNFSLFNDGEEIMAVIPTISGQAWITQHCQIVLHPSDPFLEGYTVGDIWAS